MKKTILISSIFLILGIVIGNKIYTATNSLQSTFNVGDTYYFLQEGVYSSYEIMKSNTEEINGKLVEEQNDKFYVYVGITKEEKNAKKIKEIYEEKNYQIYIKEVTVKNEEFFNNVTQFDLLINSTEDPEEILTITEVVLANYEEIIKKQ